MQLRPLLTSACGSPWVATTRLPFTATVTPQPVPQKRQGALDHFSCGSAAASSARPGSGTPATAPAAAAALRLMKSRRSIGIRNLLVHRAQAVDALIDQ